MISYFLYIGVIRRDTMIVDYTKQPAVIQQEFVLSYLVLSYRIIEGLESLSLIV